MDNSDIEQTIQDFVRAYPSEKKTTTLWQQPITGFASAQNPLFRAFKNIVHPKHLEPEELLPDAKSVVVFYVPFSRELHRENYEEEFYCSRSWAIAYIETNRLISDITRRLGTELESQGYRATLIPPTHNFDEATLMSNWSHRHVAFAAGIGRFGHHNLLITEKGCTGRLGSLVTNLYLEPSPPTQGEFCLHKAGYECQKCVTRCRYEALHAEGFDRFACHKQCKINDAHHQDLDLTEICGKCAAMVPCSVLNPVEKRGTP